MTSARSGGHQAHGDQQRLTLLIPDWTIYSGPFHEPVQRGDRWTITPEFVPLTGPKQTPAAELGYRSIGGLARYEITMDIVSAGVVVVGSIGGLRVAAWNGNRKWDHVLQNERYTVQALLSISDHADAPGYREAARRHVTESEWIVDELGVVFAGGSGERVTIENSHAVPLGGIKEFIVDLSRGA